MEVHLRLGKLSASAICSQASFSPLLYPQFAFTSGISFAEQRHQNIFKIF